MLSLLFAATDPITVFGWDEADVAFAGFIVGGVVAILTILLAWIAHRSQQAAGQSALASQKSLDAARESAQASRDSVVQATKARIDAGAPRVVAWQLPIEDDWRELRIADPVHADASTFQRAFDGTSPLAHDRHFIFDGDAGVTVARNVWLLLRNEGQATVEVRPGQRMQPASGGGYRLPAGLNVIHEPIEVNRSGFGDPAFLIPPGHALVLQWPVTKSASEWAEDWKNRDAGVLQTTVKEQIRLFDGFAEGVVDHIFVECAATPLSPVPNALGHWCRALQDNFGTTVWPTKRWYRSIDPPGSVKPSWTD